MYTRKKNPFERVGIILTLIIGRILIHLNMLWSLKVFHMVFPGEFPGLYHTFRYWFGTGGFSGFIWYFNMLLPFLIVLRILVGRRHK